jgi:DNA-binding transcriptional LysR family regulator
MQTNSSEVLRASLLAGAGIGYMPDWTFADLLASGDVVVLMPEWQVPPIPIHLVSPAARKHSAKVRAFNEHIANALRVE